MNSAKVKAIGWLKGQIVPNSTVPEPSRIRENFVLSYRLSDYSGDNKYLYGKSNLYDNAIAAIAFAMCGDFSASESILTGVLKNRTPDNDLWFSYNTHNEWPDSNDNDGAVIRTGASAWFGYAIVFYLERLNQLNKQEKLSAESGNLLNGAELIAGAILKRRITDSADLRYGLVTGGENQYRIKIDHAKNNAGEHFSAGKIEWTSTEHNLDAYFFIKGLYRLTGKEIYKTASDGLAAALSGNWSNSIIQLVRGRDRLRLDEAESLDCASWGSIFLRSAGFADRADISLLSCGRYRVNGDAPAGFRPYRNLPVFEEKEINGRMYPEDPDRNWNDLPLIWHEGSLGVAMAFLKAGKTEEAEKIISSVIISQKADGGIPYASIPVPFQFSTEDSVASAAWLVMAISAYEDIGLRDLFWK